MKKIFQKFFLVEKNFSKINFKNRSILKKGDLKIGKNGAFIDVDYCLLEPKMMDFGTFWGADHDEK